MAKKRIFISSRILEMKDYRKEAIKAIKDSGMEPVYFDSTDPKNKWSFKPGVSQIRQLLDGVRIADAFLGIYGQTLDTNWKPDGYNNKHSMVLEYEEAVTVGLPCFIYVPPSSYTCDKSMEMFRKQVMQRSVGILNSPKELYKDLLVKLKILTPKIFISYSSKDQDFVNQLHSKLKESGYITWLNTTSIPKGEKWHDEMTAGLSQTSLLILVISPDSMKSKWVKEEWKTFLKAKKKILPILYKEAKIPEAINQLEMIKQQNADWYYQLVKAIEQNLGHSVP